MNHILASLGDISESVKVLAPERDDIVTWFDLLDLDDYISFGGQG